MIPFFYDQIEKTLYTTIIWSHIHFIL